MGSTALYSVHFAPTPYRHALDSSGARPLSLSYYVPDEAWGCLRLVPRHITNLWSVRVTSCILEVAGP